MKEKHVSRRDFMKTVGVAGATTVIGGNGLLARAAAPEATNAAPALTNMPMRAFGKTGVKVPVLALGGIFDIAANQLVLQRALDFGVTYWDTANGYTNGNSEKGIGMYFAKNPEVRKKIFLVSKAGGGHSPENLDAMLAQSLQRMNTDYIDLYFLHGIRSGEDLTDEVKTWVEKAKAANKIRFFGFSSHGNMENSLQAAAKLGWIDGIMLKYDYRVMHTDAMRAATEACAKARIGLTAMKTQGGGPIKTESESDQKLAGHFLARGFTPQQAKLKAIWENSEISAICSQMSNLNVLESNAAAARDKTKLTAADHAALRHYAVDTRTHYCAGCAHLCERTVNGQAPIADVMRCLMYHHTYGDSQLASNTFQKVPPAVRKALTALDYTAAEQVCPQGLPIGALVRHATEVFA